MKTENHCLWLKWIYINAGCVRNPKQFEKFRAHCHVYLRPFFKMQMNDKKVNFLTMLLAWGPLSLQKTGKNPRVKSNNATFHLMKSSLCPCLLYLDHIFPWVWSCRGNEELIHKEGKKFFLWAFFVLIFQVRRIFDHLHEKSRKIPLSFS